MSFLIKASPHLGQHLETQKSPLQPAARQMTATMVWPAPATVSMHRYSSLAPSAAPSAGINWPLVRTAAAGTTTRTSCSPHAPPVRTAAAAVGSIVPACSTRLHRQGVKDHSGPDSSEMKISLKYDYFWISVEHINPNLHCPFTFIQNTEHNQNDKENLIWFNSV